MFAKFDRLGRREMALWFVSSLVFPFAARLMEITVHFKMSLRVENSVKRNRLLLSLLLPREGIGDNQNARFQAAK
jgi:hypothetical protein